MTRTLYDIRLELERELKQVASDYDEAVDAYQTALRITWEIVEKTAVLRHRLQCVIAADTETVNYLKEDG